MRYIFMRFPEGKGKAVTFSYDDNAVANKKLSDIMSEYGIKCTFNLNSQKSNEMFSNMLTVPEAKKYIVDRGHEIALHGAFHKGLGLVRPVEGIKDVLDLRLELEKDFGIIVRGMAYPDSTKMLHGNNWETIETYLKELGVVYSRLTGYKPDFDMPEDWYLWTPTASENHPEIYEIAEKFVNLDIKSLYIAGQYPKLFLMSGHASGFERKNNWNHFENICKILGNNKDIWYATCMEIYEYTKGYEALVWSADSTRVYNPSIFAIWFEADEKLYKINPGETIEIGE